MKLESMLIRSPNLNLDILCSLVWHLHTGGTGGTEDLLSFMSTCQSIYFAGIPALLNRELCFSEEHKLESFCDFVLRDVASRARHLSSLTFLAPMDSLDEALAEKLCRVLQHASRLHQLVFHDCDSWPRRLPTLAHAITNVKTIEHIAMHTDGGLEPVAHKMRSQIKTATIYFSAYNHFDEGDCIRFLAGFQSSLREASLQWAFFCRQHGDIVYQHVHTLRLQLFWDEFGDVGSMIAAFPSVKTLHITVDDDACKSDYGRIIRRLPRIANKRAKSWESQERIRWQYIDKICGGDVALYLAALRVDVGTLRITADQVEGDILRGILEYTRPTDRFELNVSVDWWEDQSGMFGVAPGQFEDVLRAAAPEVTHLYLTISDAPSGDEAIVRTFLHEIGQLLLTATTTQSLVLTAMHDMAKLVYLSLAINYTTSVSYPDQELVERLTAQTPNLAYVSWTFDDGEASFWRACRGEQGHSSRGQQVSISSVKQMTRVEAQELGICAKQPDSYWYSLSIETAG